MISKYFLLKTKQDSFSKKLETFISSNKEKKVLVCAEENGFIEINRIYNLTKKLNIVAIADKKYECSKRKNLLGIKTIKPLDILDNDYDTILVTNENAKPMVKYLTNKLNISMDKISCLFVEEIKDECVNYNYLYKCKFNKTLPKLIKEVGDKRVILFGAGSMLELIKKYFDISSLNVIGVSDNRFRYEMPKEDVMGYKPISPNDIKNVNPDYVIVATKTYINIFEELYYNILKDTNITIRPFIEKSIFTLIKEFLQ